MSNENATGKNLNRSFLSFFLLLHHKRKGLCLIEFILKSIHIVHMDMTSNLVLSDVRRRSEYY